jgi:two-component system chemotaxis sensor kinase CheA
MDELKIVFIEEAEDLFENISSILYSLGNRDISEEELDSLFRNFHTLKGGSGSVGFDKFVKLVHVLENFLDQLKHKKIKYSPKMVDFLIDTTEELEIILKEEANNILTDSEVEELLNKIKITINSFEDEMEFTSSIHLEIEDGDEIIDILDKLKHMVANSALEINETFRLIHTLKSAAMMLNLNSFKEYISIVESILMSMRDNNEEDEEKIKKIISSFLAEVETVLNNELSGNSFKNEQIIEKFSNEFMNKEGFELFDESQGFVLFDDVVKSPPQKQKKKKVIKPTQKTETKSFKDLISSSSIRVNLDKIENLMNRVGDLVITKSMLYEFANSFDDYDIKNSFFEKLDVLDRNVRELQDSVMSVRMVGMESIYSKLPKIIRDISKKLDKKVVFEHYGDNVEIDKLMSESLIDPLTHILRNALDHGIESPEERIKLNKPKEGKIVIKASQESGQIVITISDDGRGIDGDKVARKALENGVITQEEYNRMSDEEKVMLIFSAGLSTADKVSDISGRGVGMDVVMNNIHSIGGNIKIKTEINKGTTFIISIPLTLAILDGLNVKIGNNNFIIPLNMIVESFQPIPEIIKHIAEGGYEILMLRDEFIPVIKLYKFFGIKPKYENLTDGIIIISAVSNKKVAIFIDEFLTQEQIVVKSLDKNYKKVKGISAATIRGDGSVGLILDIPDIVEESK